MENAKVTVVMASSLDLWVDGQWGEESAGWSQEINLDVHLLLSDPRYSHIISTHIQNSLKHLARELEIIVAREVAEHGRDPDLEYFREHNEG